MSQSGTVSRWSTQEPKHTSIPLPFVDHTTWHGPTGFKLALVTDDHIIAAGPDVVNVYTLPDCQLLHCLEAEGTKKPVVSLDAHHEAGSGTLVVASCRNHVRFWDIGSGAYLGRVTFGTHPCLRVDVAFHLLILKPELVDKGQRGAVGKGMWPKEPLVLMWNRASSALWICELPLAGRHGSGTVATDHLSARCIETHGHALTSVDAKGRRVLTGSLDCTVRVWDVVTGDREWCFVGHATTVTSVKISDSKAYSISLDGKLRIWSLSTGECSNVLEAGSDRGYIPIEISNIHLVYPPTHRTLCIWDIIKERPKYHLADVNEKVWYHDDVKIIVESDGALKVTDISTRIWTKELRPQLGDVGKILWVCFRGRFCVASVRRSAKEFLEVWDFGGDAAKMNGAESIEDLNNEGWTIVDVEVEEN